MKSNIVVVLYGHIWHGHVLMVDYAVDTTDVAVSSGPQFQLTGLIRKFTKLNTMSPASFARIFRLVSATFFLPSNSGAKDSYFHWAIRVFHNDRSRS